MIDRYRHRARPIFRAAILFVVALSAACGPKKGVIPANESQPDRFLMNRGDEELRKKHWSNAREYYRQVVDNYPQSPLRPDAKLGVGETYLGEGSAEALVMGANEFREFLTFYPTNPKADVAQFRLAMCAHKAVEVGGVCLVLMVQGNLAQVWAPYDFHLDGKLSHCGIDSFSLVRNADGWRVVGVSYTVQKVGCAPSPLGSVE